MTSENVISLINDNDLLGLDTSGPLTEGTFTRPSRATARKLRDVDVVDTQGLEEIGRWKGYRSYHPPGNTDPWVRQALKLYSRETYEDIRGFTRRGEGLPGVYKSLDKYKGTISRFTDFSDVQRPAMVSAISKARKAFSVPHKKQPYRPHQVGQHIKTNTSAGFTFPGKLKRDVMPEIYQEARYLAHRIKYSGERFNPTRVRFAPCLAGSRGHLSPEDEIKTRLVWVYPAEMLVIEGLFAPIIYSSLVDLGPDCPLMVGKGSHRLYAEWLSNYKDGEKLHGLDFSAFDTHVPPWLIHVAFDILKDCIDFEYDGNRRNTASGRRKLGALWSAVKWYFINTPILMPDGRLFRKHHGVPSGSYFTQLIDSVVSYILVSYVTEIQHLEVRRLKVLGDDSQFRSPSSLDLERAQRDCDACGMTLKVEKCDVSEDPANFKSLGTRYRNGHAWREDDEWFKLALYPENVPPDIGTSFTRLVGLWIGGAMFSEKFRRFMDFFQSCYPVPDHGDFSKDQRKWLEIVYGGKAPRGWSTKTSLFWRSFFYTL
jgi:hypothetical protein